MPASMPEQYGRTNYWQFFAIPCDVTAARQGEQVKTRTSIAHLWKTPLPTVWISFGIRRIGSLHGSFTSRTCG
ncbi:Uncharacterized protein APZ42_015127 [Daphnia magna]|uniref:Uncharacterized protein n=1 Tax=Daphnia magna TaxID=35525 RepID=A0A162P7K7_9CRUS|nr:Uncharacterized protein APZ42_015127 [Daphnia magna]